MAKQTRSGAVGRTNFEPPKPIGRGAQLNKLMELRSIGSLDKVKPKFTIREIIINNLEREAIWRTKRNMDRNVAVEFFQYFMKNEKEVINRIEKSFSVKHRPVVIFRQNLKKVEESFWSRELEALHQVFPLPPEIRVIIQNYFYQHKGKIPLESVHKEMKTIRSQLEVKGKKYTPKRVKKLSGTSEEIKYITYCDPEDNKERLILKTLRKIREEMNLYR